MKWWRGWLRCSLNPSLFLPQVPIIKLSHLMTKDIPRGVFPLHPSMHASIHSFMHPFMHARIHSFINLSMHPCVLHSPINLLIIPFNHAFIHLFTYASLHSRFHAPCIHAPYIYASMHHASMHPCIHAPQRTSPSTW